MADEVKTSRYVDSVTGSVVNVDEETAAKLGPTYQAQSDAKSSSRSSK